MLSVAHNAFASRQQRYFLLRHACPPYFLPLFLAPPRCTIANNPTQCCFDSAPPLRIKPSSKVLLAATRDKWKTTHHPQQLVHASPLPHRPPRSSAAQKTAPRTCSALKLPCCTCEPTPAPLLPRILSPPPAGPFITPDTLFTHRATFSASTRSAAAIAVPPPLQNAFPTACCFYLHHFLRPFFFYNRLHSFHSHSRASIVANIGTILSRRRSLMDRQGPPPQQQPENPPYPPPVSNPPTVPVTPAAHTPWGPTATPAARHPTMDLSPGSLFRNGRNTHGPNAGRRSSSRSTGAGAGAHASSSSYGSSKTKSSDKGRSGDKGKDSKSKGKEKDKKASGSSASSSSKGSTVPRRYTSSPAARTPPPGQSSGWKYGDAQGSGPK